MMEDSNYDSHILDVEREKLDWLALKKPMELVPPDIQKPAWCSYSEGSYM